MTLARLLRVTIPSRRRLKSGDGLIAAELPLMVTFQMVWRLHCYASTFATSGKQAV